MKHPTPPTWINRLLEWVCEPKLLDSILGDLQEIYADRLLQHPTWKANVLYCFAALGFMRPFAWKKQNPSPINHLDMLKNYLKIAFRHLIKNKGYSAINIIGLTVSFACCLLIGLYVQNELSYDRYHEKHPRLYRMVNYMSGASFENGMAKVSELWAPEAQNTIPEIENTCRFVFYGQTLVTKGAEQYYENGGLFADSTVFDLFDWKLINGHPKQALTEPNTIILTRSLAEKYFPGQNPVGQTLNFDNESEMRITGVVEDIPTNSHFQFRFLVSLVSYDPPDQGNKWSRWLQYYSYVLLRPGTDPQEVADKVDAMLAQHLDEETSEAWRPQLQPIADIHLHSKLHREMSTNGDMSYIYIFSVIALFILLIACTNFVNLFTARATQRAKEVGVRKVVGANRISLIQQFLGESMLLTVLSAIIAAGLAHLLLRSINTALNRQLELNLWENGPLTLGLVAMTLLTGLLAGSYPAFVLSAFKPINVLKTSISSNSLVGRMAGLGRRDLLRKGLVVFQFSLATFLIIAALVITKQLDYIQSKNLGFNQDQVIYVPMSTPQTIQKAETIKEELLKIPGVLKVSASANRPGGSDYGVPYQAEGLPEDQQPPMRCLVVDEDFLDTYEMELAAGRSFSKDISTDSMAYLINEAAARQLGWENPLGQRLSMPAVEREPAPIIGIVKDFHYRSLHEPIAPLYFFMEKTWYSQFNLKLDANRIDETLALLEEAWIGIEPNHPFRYTFFDQSFGALHAADRRTGRIIRWFTFLAIFITCLGLLGLSTYTAERRTKEIGIRKVFGASAGQIWLLLSKEILVLVGASVVIATPIAWLVTSNWLENFAYNINLGVGIFLLAGVLAIGIALLTVGYRTMRSALSDPVDALRYE